MWQMFRLPLLLAVVSLVGLAGTLLAEGWSDAIWIAGVALPILVVVKHSAQRW